MNNTTRRHPRTMQEAFGPYTDRNLYTKPVSHTKDILLATAIGLALAAILFFNL